MNTCDYLQHNSIKRNGIRMRDQLTLYPLSGNKKKIKLSKVSYKVTKRSSGNCIVDKDVIYLPVIDNQDINIQIYAIKMMKDIQRDDDYRFMIKSNNSVVMKINSVS